jgi:hypothetical protein
LIRRIEDLATTQEQLDIYKKNVYNLSVYKIKSQNDFIGIQTNLGEFDT